MKRLFSLCCAIALLHLMGCNGTETQEPTKEAPQGPPYTVQVEEFVNPAIPGLHSYTHAHYQDKLIMIGGRTNGMHENYNFDQTYANKMVYVIDTKNFSDPETWEVHSALADVIASNIPIRGQFIANNAQYFQEKDVLYIVGGLLYANVRTSLAGRKEGKVEFILEKPKKTQDGRPATGPQTLPVMTAIDLSALVEAVMEQKPLAAPSFRQAREPKLAITGGELGKIDENVYLAFGWRFGTETDSSGATSTIEDYSHEVRRFTYTDDGFKLTLGPIEICPTCSDGSAPSSLDGYFRRRDGAMDGVIDPMDGKPGFVWYGGVFKNGNTYFDDPVLIKANSAAVVDATLYWNIYTCRLVNAYSHSKKEMYASPLGGMTYVKYTGEASDNPVLLSGENTRVLESSGGSFNHIPLSNAFTTVLTRPDGSMHQYLLPDSFPPIKTPLILPAVGDTIPADTLPAGTVTWNGSESEIFWTIDEGMLLAENVIDYDAFIKANPKGGTVAYLHGGIEGAQPNVFGLGDRTLHVSVASKRLFAVKILPLAE